MVLELQSKIVIRYLRMGAGQFLRDFRKDYHLQKTSEVRDAEKGKGGEEETQGTHSPN